MPELEMFRGKIQEIYCPLTKENCKKRCIFYNTKYTGCLVERSMLKLLGDL